MAISGYLNFYIQDGGADWSLYEIQAEGNLDLEVQVFYFWSILFFQVSLDSMKMAGRFFLLLCWKVGANKEFIFVCGKEFRFYSKHISFHL